MSEIASLRCVRGAVTGGAGRRDRLVKALGVARCASLFLMELIHPFVIRRNGPHRTKNLAHLARGEAREGVGGDVGAREE